MNKFSDSKNSAKYGSGMGLHGTRIVEPVSTRFNPDELLNPALLDVRSQLSLNNQFFVFLRTVVLVVVGRRNWTSPACLGTEKLFKNTCLDSS